jgi:hypothetical protein
VPLLIPKKETGRMQWKHAVKRLAAPVGYSVTVDISNIRSNNFETSVLSFNPLTPNDLQKRRAVSPLKIKIPSKNMCENPTNTIIHSVYSLCMVAPTCFGITLPSSGNIF